MVIIFLAACEDDKSTNNTEDNEAFNNMQASVRKMITQMDTMSMTMDPDYDFAKMMIPHHQGAIDLADIVIAEGHSDSVKQLAQRIKTSNAMSRDMMIDYINTHSPGTMADTMYMHEMEMGMMKMKNNLMAQHSHADPDADFCTLMIHHHQGAIDMAELVVHYGDDPEMIEEAEKTIEEQQKDIVDLSEFLESH